MTCRSGTISPGFSTTSALSALPTQAPAPLPSSTQVPVPSPPTESIQAPTLSHPPIHAPVPRHVGSLHASQGPPPPDQDATEAWIPCLSSISSLRVPRDPSTGRLARRSLSGSVYTRSAAGQSESSSTTGLSATGLPTTDLPATDLPTTGFSASGLSHMTNSPADVSESAGIELICQGQKQLELREMEVAATVNANQAVVQETARVGNLTMTLMQATFELSQQETTQRMQLDQQRLELEQNRLELEQNCLELEAHRLTLEVEHMALQSIASQMSTGVAPLPGITFGPQAHPTRARELQSSQPVVLDFGEWLDQARAYHAHSMGYPGLAPAPDSSTLVAVNRAAPHHHTQQAGLSNHPGRLRGFTPPSDSQFKEMGTVVGTPRAAAVGGGSANIEGMELEGDSKVEDGGEQYDD
ncbi:hypothetical protein FRC10_006039 [Ceratobasidium sp. 414]|nr:hypothetical protein FRC10_006039 [Ceratobasidium sp. 414]